MVENKSNTITTRFYIYILLQCNVRRNDEWRMHLFVMTEFLFVFGLIETIEISNKGYYCQNKNSHCQIQMP